MGIKLNVGVSKKIGLPDFGSAGSQCNLEIELDSSALERPEEFHRRVREAYAACRSAVEDELGNHKKRAADLQNKERAEQPSGSYSTNQPARQATTVSESTYRSGSSNRLDGRSPSTKQRDYIQRLAGQVKDFSAAKLDNLCERMYQKPLTALSGLEASNLIDTLREAKQGKLAVSSL